MLRLNASDGAKESGSGLCDELFFAVKFVSEMLAKGPRQPALMASAVNQFMKERLVVVRGIDETETGRKMDGVGFGR